MHICRELFKFFQERTQNGEKEITLNLHSSYKNTQNFLLDDMIVSAIRAEKVIAPFSFCAPASFFDLKNSYIKVTLLNINSLKISYEFFGIKKNLFFDYSNCVNLILNNYFKFNLTDEFIKYFYKYLENSKCEGSLFSQYYVKSDKFIYEKLNKLKHLGLTSNEKHPELGEVLSNLIGLGVGLTPSGDDFILGFIFVLKLYNFQNINYVVSELEEKVDKTNDISKAMLINGFKFRFNSNLINLSHILGCFSSGQEHVCINKISLLQNYGHSSWQDCLFGVYCALIFFSNN